MGSEKVAIIGCGFIGQSWAMAFAGAGYKVVLYDKSKEQLDGVLEKVLVELRQLKEDGLLRGSLSVEEQIGLMSTNPNLAEVVNGAMWVQESVFENVELKREVFKELDKVAEEGQVIGSSTSFIAASRFTESLKHADCCIVTHPCNPPYYCTVVEVVPSKWTKPEITEKAMNILKKIGQKPVLVKKEVVGFALNRIQYAIIGEAMRLVKEGVCTVEGIDDIMTEGLGMRYAFIGPFAVTHLNAPGGFKDYAERYGAGIVETQKDFGPVPEFDPEVTDVIQTAMDNKIPQEDFKEKLLWRNRCLAKLSKVKKDAGQ